MKLSIRFLRILFVVACVVAFLGFASTIDTRLWGHPWAERAQDIAMFGGLATMVIAGILMIVAAKPENRA